jgi:hypothetical protein
MRMMSENIWIMDGARREGKLGGGLSFPQA